MGKYLINGSTYEIDPSIQGDELTKTLTDLSAQPADPRGAKIDAHAAETDRLLGLTPGTSARQLYQESKFDDKALSKRGARGLAQVMPRELGVWSERAGRKLDPHNTDDALWMHRAAMTENMGHFKNEADALRAYNGGWDPKNWDNTETKGYVAKIMGDAPQRGFGPVPEKVDPAKLAGNGDWLKAVRQMHSLRVREPFEGTDEELSTWGKNLMGNFNFNIVDMGRYAHDLTTNGTDEDKQAFIYMMDTYENTVMSWEGAGRAALGIATDPTNVVGLGTLGVGSVAKVMASAAAKQGLKRALLKSIGRTGIIAGVEGAVLGAAENTIRQGVRVDAGAQEDFSFSQLAGNTAIGAAGGLVLGTAADAAFTAISGVVRRGATRRAQQKVTEAALRAEPTLVPPGTAAAPVGAPGALPGASPAGRSAAALPEITLDGPKLVPDRVLTEAEIAAATARQQKGRLWVDDLPPVVPGNKELADAIGIPTRAEGLRGTPRADADVLHDGGYVADQLRDLDDKNLAATLEGLRDRAYTVEELGTVSMGVQLHAGELKVEQAELIKKIGLSTNAQETTKMVQRLAQVESRLVVPGLADDAFGSMAGSMLRQRQLNPFALSGVTVESLKVERKLTQVQAEKLFTELVDGARLDAGIQAVGRTYDADIQKALDAGDSEAVIRLQTMKQREMDALVDRAVPTEPGYWAKANEWVISNVFTPTTLAINIVPAAMKTVLTPLVKAIVSDPLQAAARRELWASYAAMQSTFGGAWRASKAAYRLEQSILTRGTGRLLEGELAIQGRKGGIVRFFPRLLNATDEFLGHLNYNSYIAGQAAAKAHEEGVVRGMTGKLLNDYVKNGAELAMEQAYKQDSAEAMLQPVVNKGVNLGLTGEKLIQFIEREAMKDPRALRHGSDEVALDFVRDMLYKRQFSGKGQVSGGVRALETLVNRVPALKIVTGQLFFRTPIRVFEEGIRLTPGLQILAPNFISDLAGKNGAGRQARAQGEAMASLAITGAVMSLYAAGKISGDGAPDSWKQQRTAGDGPGQPPNSIKMSDGSTWTFRSFDPVATPFKIIVNGLERLDKLAMRQAQGELIDKSTWDKAQAYLTVGTSAIAAALRDANLAGGVDGLMKLMENLGDPEGKEDAWLKFFGQQLSLAVPNTFHKLMKQNDPTLKDPAEFWQVVEARLHFDMDDVKTSYSYDTLGNVRKMADTGTLWNIFSVATREERNRELSPDAQYVMLELDRLQRETGAIFSTPTKHPMMGVKDLRTVLTADGTETLYDRWQKNYAALKPETLLKPILEAALPEGTRKDKGAKREAVEGIIKELRDGAFMQTMAQEQTIVDKLIEGQQKKAKAEAGLFDYRNRN